jgi:hypothetical protein
MAAKMFQPLGLQKSHWKGEPLTITHDLAEFSCSKPSLDRAPRAVC